MIPLWQEVYRSMPPLTAAASIAVGLGKFVDAFFGVLFALIVLMAVGKFGGNGPNPSESESSYRHSV